MLKIHCSSLHKIMGTPKTKGETLSQTAKSHLNETAKRQLFGFTQFKDSGCTEKGRLLEDTAIKASGMVRGQTYTKHNGRLENHWISGECDIYDPKNSLIIDTKCTWSIGTHPFTPEEAEKKAAEDGYIWQMHGYMWLYGCERAEIDFWLFPTPENLLKPWEANNPDILAQYTKLVERIPLKQRRSTVVVERNQDAIDEIAGKVEAAQTYYRKLIQAMAG